MTAAESAWLEYQVIMGAKLDLENVPKVDRMIYQAIFADGFNMGIRYASGA